MTYSVKQQLRRVRKLRRELRARRTWVVVCEAGREDESEQLQEARRKYQPGDLIIIRLVPANYMGLV